MPPQHHLHTTPRHHHHNIHTTPPRHHLHTTTPPPHHLHGTRERGICQPSPRHFGHTGLGRGGFASPAPGILVIRDSGEGDLPVQPQAFWSYGTRERGICQSSPRHFGH